MELVAKQRTDRREVVRVVVSLIGFSLVASALGAGKLQSNTGGTWIHAYLVSLPIVLAMATPVGVFMIFFGLRRGDRDGA